MHQEVVDQQFTALTRSIEHEANVINASYDDRLLALASRYLQKNQQIDYDMIWQIANQYRITRDDVLDYACNLSMVHVLEDSEGYHG